MSDKKYYMWWSDLGHTGAKKLARSPKEVAQWYVDNLHAQGKRVGWVNVTSTKGGTLHHYVIRGGKVANKYTGRIEGHRVLSETALKYKPPRARKNPTKAKRSQKATMRKIRMAAQALMSGKIFPDHAPYVSYTKETYGDVLAMFDVSDSDTNIKKLARIHDALMDEALERNREVLWGNYDKSLKARLQRHKKSKGKNPRKRTRKNPMDIVTDHKWKQLKYGHEVPKKVLEDFDWLDDAEIMDGFFKYRDRWYHISDFQRTSGDLKLLGWDGIHQDSFFSGVVIKLSDDSEEYQVGLVLA